MIDVNVEQLTRLEDLQGTNPNDEGLLSKQFAVGDLLQISLHSVVS